MYYYTFNIGDYQSHTGHLDPLEDIAYRRMIDWCYLHQKPLPDDTGKIGRLIRMPDNLAVIRDILNEFFTLTPEGWWQQRIEEEIARYEEKREQASRAGKASAERRLNGRLTERSTGVQPTNNQEPITKNQVKKTAAAVPPEGVSQSVWEDFLQLRKVKKAPMTNAALAGIMREAEKAKWTLEQAISECCARGWTGFKADWVAERLPVGTMTTPSKPDRDPALVKLDQDAARRDAPPPEVRQKLQALLRKVT